MKFVADIVSSHRECRHRIGPPLTDTHAHLHTWRDRDEKKKKGNTQQGLLS